MKSGYFTECPLVVIGATGRLSSELVFYALLQRFSRRLVLCGGSEERLQGLRDEIEESSFGDEWGSLEIHTTLSMEEAVSEGGYLLFAKSVQSSPTTREAMLLSNAPFAVECGRALSAVRDKVERVVCVSNPSDLMGLTLLVHSGLSPERVMSLSSLDTERFRRTLVRRLGVPPRVLSDVYTLGSHDGAMAPMLDRVRVNGASLSEMGISSEEEVELVRAVRYGGISIYKQRGQTAYQSPAVHVLRMLMATDNDPFELPTARYHHSRRYPHTFGSLLTKIDGQGCHHLPTKLTARDGAALDGAFASIERMKQQLIKGGYLPDPSEWACLLQTKEELVEMI